MKEYIHYLISSSSPSWDAGMIYFMDAETESQGLGAWLKW
jgi:hypothetical protein